MLQIFLMPKPRIAQKIDYIFSLSQINALKADAESSGKNSIMVSLAVNENALTLLIAKPVNYKPDEKGMLVIDDNSFGDDYEEACPIPPDCRGGS